VPPGPSLKPPLTIALIIHCFPLYFHFL